ncbi:hypothetical protein L6R49_17765 [Myxococcota bacterium]|nr:hypothetical protein [Myxococcota bacterium]
MHKTLLSALLWLGACGSSSGPLVWLAADGDDAAALRAAGGGRELSRLDPSATTRWRREVGPATRGPSQVWTGAPAWILTSAEPQGWTLLGIHPEAGETLWRWSPGEGVEPVVEVHAEVVTARWGDQLALLSRRDGALLWRRTVPVAGGRQATQVSRGRVLVADILQITALDLSGAPIFTDRAASGSVGLVGDAAVWSRPDGQGAVLWPDATAPTPTELGGRALPGVLRRGERLIVPLRLESGELGLRALSPSGEALWSLVLGAGDLVPLAALDDAPGAAPFVLDVAGARTVVVVNLDDGVVLKRGAPRTGTLDGVVRLTVGGQAALGAGGLLARVDAATGALSAASVGELSTPLQDRLSPSGVWTSADDTPKLTPLGDAAANDDARLVVFGL